MTKILAINGSYRVDGAIDQAVDVAAHAAAARGATVEFITLRDLPIEFCRNCRECTQVPGEAPGVCVHDDAMRALIAKIESADGYILASPTNMFSVTAVFKRFMERLIVYAYWPWGALAPKPRRPQAAKKAMLIASCAAPGFLGRWFFTTLKQLRMTAKTFGAKPVASTFIGMVSKDEHPGLTGKTQERLRSMAARLA